LQFLFAMS